MLGCHEENQSTNEVSVVCVSTECHSGISSVTFGKVSCERPKLPILNSSVMSNVKDSHEVYIVSRG